MTCQHLQSSQDAVTVTRHGYEPTVDYVCAWSDDNDETVNRLPSWAASHVRSGGPNFQPDRHCGPHCPGFRPFDFRELLR